MTLAKKKLLYGSIQNKAHISYIANFILVIYVFRAYFWALLPFDCTMYCVLLICSLY